MIKAVFFDLDGTLLPMEENTFIDKYFKLLCDKMVKYGYERDTLINAIWTGTKAMYKNDGSLTNKEVFWNTVKNILGDKVIDDIPLFDEFYVNEFKELKSACMDNKYAKDIIDFCNKNLEYTILATNPIFPKEGTKTRMSFIGLKEEDFSFVTYYENFNFCKPNPKYFIELLNKFDLKPEEVILFGNNVLEDGECGLEAKIKCYLVEGFIINHSNSKKIFPIIKMNEIIEVIKKYL